jgi:hypothetical protein
MKKVVPIIFVAIALVVTYIYWPSGDSREAQNSEVIEKIEELSLEIKDLRTAENIIEVSKLDSSETRTMDSTELVRFREVQQRRIDRLESSDKKNETPESILEKYKELMGNAKSECDTVPLQLFIKDYMSDEIVVSMKQANTDFKAALRALSKERRQVMIDCRN